MENDEKKPAEFKVKDSQSEEKQKKVNKRILFAFIGGTVLIMDIVSLLAYLSLNKNMSYEYKVGESTITLYNNILGFFDKCSEGLHPTPNKVISVTYKDHYLSLVGINDENAIVIKHQTDKDNINDALQAFTAAIPNIGDTEVESSYIISPDKLNIENKEYIGTISTSLTNDKYISYTCRIDNKNLFSYPVQLYNESGNYKDGISANIKDNRFLYDLYYYIIYSK